MSISSLSIVNYYGDLKQENCGYCNTKNSCCNCGLWAHVLTPHHYELLLDRGWRRCGNFQYKPNVEKSCCALYTIRCDTTLFTLRKSHKRVLRRMRRYLISGNQTSAENESQSVIESGNEPKDHVFSQYLNGKRICLSNILGPTRDDYCTPSRKQNQPKDLLFHIDNTLPPNSAHKLKVVLRSCDPPCPEFQDSFDESYNLYKKYQTIIHKDSEVECRPEQFRAFLCTSPLVQEYDGHVEYGSFHMQYWLDDSLLAVGVIDILPHSFSSKYFYYDPDYSFLSLGTYSILREIAYLRELSCFSPQLRYYYLGFYIANCPKMSYKGKLDGSFLLCPTTYQWCPFDKCFPLISGDCHSCRFFEGDSEFASDDCLTRVNFLFRNKLVNYRHYLLMRRVKELDEDELANIRDFVKQVGTSCLENMYLYSTFMAD